MVKMHQGTSAGVLAHGCCLRVIGSTAPGHDITLFPHLISVFATDVPAKSLQMHPNTWMETILTDVYCDFDKSAIIFVGSCQAGRNMNCERVKIKI